MPVNTHLYCGDLQILPEFEINVLIFFDKLYPNNRPWSSLSLGLAYWICTTSELITSAETIVMARENLFQSAQLRAPTDILVTVNSKTAASIQLTIFLIWLDYTRALAKPLFSPHFLHVLYFNWIPHSAFWQSNIWPKLVSNSHISPALIDCPN